MNEDYALLSGGQKHSVHRNAKTATFTFSPFLACSLHINLHFFICPGGGEPEDRNKLPTGLESVQSTLSHLISTSVPRATFTRFLVEHRLFQYYS